MDGNTLSNTRRRPRAISVFSGMEAASVAATPFDWDFRAFAEIDPAACWTLHHHHGCGHPLHLPDPAEANTKKERLARAARIKALSTMPEAAPGAPVNLGDATQVDWAAWRGQIDVVVGGPPCQSFSLAGMRKSLDDHRGNLSLHYVRAIHDIQPLWVFTENVPGWLNTKDNAFGCYLGALVGADTPLDPPNGKRWGSAGVVDGPCYRAAWRILDAQGFVPQRRRRVFVVASRVGSGGNPIRVLFETEAEARLHLGERADCGPLFSVGEGGRGDTQPSGQTGQSVAGNPEGSAGGRGEKGLNIPFAVDTWNQSVSDVTAPLRDTNGTFGDALPAVVCAEDADIRLSPAARAFGRNNCSGEIEVATAVNAHGGPNGRQDFETETFLVHEVESIQVREVESIAFHGRQDVVHGAIVHALDTDAHTACVLTDGHDERDHDVVAFTTKDYGADAGDVAPTLRAGPHVESHANSGVHVGVIYSCDATRAADEGSAEQVVAVEGDIESFATETGAGFWSETLPALRVTTAPSQPQTIVKQVGMVVRRLMPGECLALQGFPTDYLEEVRFAGRPLADGPKYKLCGNSWAVPLISWVFARLDSAFCEQFLAESD